MLVENITVSTAELNLGTDVAKAITEVKLYKDEGFHSQPMVYATSKAIVKNDTAANLEIVLLSSVEKREYDADPTITDKIVVLNGTTTEININKYRMTHVVVKGAGAGHTSDLTIVLIKE